MEKTGTCKLQHIGYAYGSVTELAVKEVHGYIVPESISLFFDDEPLRYTQVDRHGNPQIGGVAHTLLLWKTRQMVRDGKIDSIYSATVDYRYEVISTTFDYPIPQRLPQPNICPVCGRPITTADLDGNITVSSVAPDSVITTAHSRIDTICDGNIVVHHHCAREYQRLQMIDDITETVGLVFGSYDIDEENRFPWGHGDHEIWYELIPNEYCSHECYAHRPWFLFHTPIGDIKIGWRKRVINLTFMPNFASFDMDVFKDEDVTKFVRDGARTIHAWGSEKLYEYLNLVHGVVLPNRRKT